MDTNFDNRHPFCSGTWSRLGTLCFVVTALTGQAQPARAADGCLVLLCFAAPSWQSIPKCVPPIREVLRDLSRGRPFPSCGMAGAGNSARHDWAQAPHNCPPQYTQVVDAEGSPLRYCEYSGVISVTIGGVPFTRTWWRFSSETVTEYTPAAKAQLAHWDTRFDDDHATWLASQPPTSARADHGD